MKLPIVALFMVLTAFISGCSTFLVNGNSKGLKEQALMDMYPILSKDDYRKLKRLTSEDEVRNFIQTYWNDCDPSPGTADNELKAEFDKRLSYTNEHFPDKKGWGRSDRKRIYVQNGAPAFIDRSDWSEIPLSHGKRIKSLEIWVYSQSAKMSSLPTIMDRIYPGQKRFIFADIYGAGEYQIIYSSEDIQDISSFIYTQF